MENDRRNLTLMQHRFIGGCIIMQKSVLLQMQNVKISLSRLRDKATLNQKHCRPQNYREKYATL